MDLTSEHYPPGLQAGGKQLWDKINEYDLDPAEEALLLQAARVMDNLDRLAADINGMGMVVAGSERQPRPNPLLIEQREQAKLLDALLRSIALPVGGEAYGTRRSGDQKKAAKAGRPMKSRPARIPYNQGA
jgi:hypothetical protein